MAWRQPLILTWLKMWLKRLWQQTKRSGSIGKLRRATTRMSKPPREKCGRRTCKPRQRRWKRWSLSLSTRYLTWTKPVTTVPYYSRLRQITSKGCWCSRRPDLKPNRKLDRIPVKPTDHLITIRELMTKVPINNKAYFRMLPMLVHTIIALAVVHPRIGRSWTQSIGEIRPRPRRVAPISQSGTTERKLKPAR